MKQTSPLGLEIGSPEAKQATLLWTGILTSVLLIVLGGFSSILGAVFGALFFYGAPVWIDWMAHALERAGKLDALLAA